jgi:hypothetical protein
MPPIGRDPADKWHFAILNDVEDGDTPKAWVLGLPDGLPEKVPLARVVDADGGMDEAENTYYEWAADPDSVHLETTQRRYRGQYLRRLRRLRERTATNAPD